MNKAQEKYKHIALEQKPSKWRSINLSNQAKELSVSEARELLKDLVPILHDRVRDRVKRLEELKAPDIIMNNEQKLLEKLERPDIMKVVHPVIGPLKSRIKNNA